MWKDKKKESLKDKSNLQFNSNKNYDKNIVTRKLLGEVIMNYEKIFKELMRDVENMTTDEKKHFRNLIFSAIGDLDILILFEEKEWR